MTVRHLIAVVAAGAFASFLAGAVVAQTSMDDPLDDHSAKRLDRMEKVVRELRAIVFQGRETGQPVIVQPADTDSQIAALTQRVTDLEQSLTRLNGALEVTNHNLDQSHRDMADLHGQIAALQARIAELEQKVTTLTAPPPPPPVTDSGQPGPANTAPPEDPVAAFAAAKRLLLDGDYPSAETSFSEFVSRFGDTPKGPEARYYLGKTLLARRAYSEAATADIAAVRGWPQTAWAPDAVLDLSRALIGLKRAPEACQILDQLNLHYPKTSVDIKARVTASRTQAQCP
jgi:tol-pal system protein YbgF